MINKDWWQKFLSDTEEFSRPVVYDGAIKSDVSFLSKCTSNIFRDLAIEGSKAPRFRVWVGETVDDIELNNDYIKKIYDTPPDEDENIVDYTKRIFGDLKFGLIINDGESFSNEMNRWLLSFFEPLFEIKGKPLIGISVTYFIGNYGYTPLGIHTDGIGENVFHFHLGPGSKTIYTWDYETYDKLTGIKYNNKEIDPLLSEADSYTFHEGDIFYMPWTKFHVANNETDSVGLTAWLNSPTSYSLAYKMMNMISTNEIYEPQSKEHAVIEKYVLPLDPTSTEDLATFDNMNLPDGSDEMTFKDLMRRAYEHFRLGLASNGGFSMAPYINIKKDDQLQNDSDVVLKGIEPYKILLKEEGEMLNIYVRSKKIQLKTNPGVSTLIDILNSYKQTALSDLLNCMSDYWSDEITLKVLNLIYEKGGFEVVDSSEVLVTDSEEKLALVTG